MDWIYSIAAHPNENFWIVADETMMAWTLNKNLYKKVDGTTYFSYSFDGQRHHSEYKSHCIENGDDGESLLGWK